MAPVLICKQDGPVASLTLNRPEKANALSAELVESLIEAVARAYGDGTRLLAIDAAGNHFCAGFDFGNLENSNDAELALRFIRIELLLQSIHHAPFRTLVTAQGGNFGAGTDLIAACDVRVAAPSATFRLPGLQFDVVLGTRRFAERVGSDVAREILSSGRTFSAAEAMQNGFVTRLAEPDEWARIRAEQADTCALLNANAMAALHRRTVVDARADDLAELVRSVAVPGLKERILKFRAR